MNRTPLIICALLAAWLAGACSHNASDVDYSGGYAVTDTARFPYDLYLYELAGPVKEVTHTTCYSVAPDGRGGYQVTDSSKSAIQSSTIHFTQDGHLRLKDDESVRRDTLGRLVKWRNNRPNAKGVPVSFAADTLRYTWIDDNHLLSSGMGAYAVIVYDRSTGAPRVVGQYAVPNLGPTRTSAFNIYTQVDRRGNWTERVTIWSTEGNNGREPSLNYTIERRAIRYYPVK